MVARISKNDRLCQKVQLSCLAVEGLLLINIKQELVNDSCLQNE
jgi:hypothetical protein